MVQHRPMILPGLACRARLLIRYATVMLLCLETVVEDAQARSIPTYITVRPSLCSITIGLHPLS